jgi:2-keto-3-deoxy-L-rhamnonate aldolase RhmA
MNIRVLLDIACRQDLRSRLHLHRCQHSLFSVESVSAIAQAALGAVLRPGARTFDDPNTQVLLDNGAVSIVFPDVNTAEQAGML